MIFTISVCSTGMGIIVWLLQCLYLRPVILCKGELSENLASGSPQRADGLHHHWGMSLSSWLGPGSSAYVAQGYLQCYAQIVLEYRLLAYWRSNSPIPFSCLLLLWMMFWPGSRFMRLSPVNGGDSHWGCHGVLGLWLQAPPTVFLQSPRAPDSVSLLHFILTFHDKVLSASHLLL